MTAVANLQTGWIGLKGDLQEIVDALNAGKGDEGTTWLINDLNTAKADWDVAKTLAVKLQSNGTIPVQEHHPDQLSSACCRLSRLVCAAVYRDTAARYMNHHRRYRMAFSNNDLAPASDYSAAVSATVTAFTSIDTSESEMLSMSVPANPSVLNLPSHVQAAKAAANTWNNTIKPQVTANLRDVVGYASLFNTLYAQLSTDAVALQARPS